MIENIRRAEDPTWRQQFERQEVLAKLGRMFGRPRIRSRRWIIMPRRSVAYFKPIARERSVGIGEPTAAARHLDRRSGREARLPLCAQRGQAFLDLGAGEAQELQRQRSIERGPGEAELVVERVLGPADC
jgi:hypothetical protein